MNRKLDIDKERAKELFIEGIKVLEAHNKREYIQKNLQRGNRYPSISFMTQRLGIDFNECREIAGIEHLTHKKWTKSKLEHIIKELLEKYSCDELTHEKVKEETGIHLGTTIKRVFGITFTELKERLKIEEAFQKK